MYGNLQRINIESIAFKGLIFILSILFLWCPILICSASEREMQYYPDKNTWVCVNGHNRYTRALYGSAAEYRIETSDRPIFAVYKKNSSRNLRFRVVYRGISLQLDSVDYCEARYEGGKREYLLKDKHWDGGELRLTVLAYPASEGGIWRFSAQGFGDVLSIEGIVCETAVKKFVRAGDLGRFEKPGCFEPTAAPQFLQVEKGNVNDNHSLFFSLDETLLSVGTSRNFIQRFAMAENWRRELASSVSFQTPDKYLNPLGSALVMAADGIWGGQVWMHGAVGWRMPLPGWRGAYAGDFLGMFDRQRTHFDAYAHSMVTDVPVTLPHLMDSTNRLARGAYRWGTPMYSNGYICRNPENNHQFHHYDMNLIYIDQLLWHFQFDADTAYMRRMWPVLKNHLAWEKSTWDPDHDGLYDAYCCIWASDALQYNSGGVTHSSAYNYRGNLLAARIARLIGENPEPYEAEAQKIKDALNRYLWLEDKGHWAEYKDFMGKKRVHPNAALWSVYTPVDCGVGDERQNYLATRYVDSHIPHIPFDADGNSYYTLSTSDWSPYEWSINNVAMAEVMHTVLAYYQAGRTEEAYRLLKANILDFMYLGSSPANFGQLSALDRATGECYRDFADVVGISSRTLIEGLFGITPHALEGRCIIRPGFPAAWDSASVHTPYLDYSFRRIAGREVFDVRQNFKRPLQIVVRQNLGQGKYRDIQFTDSIIQHLEIPAAGYMEEPPARREEKMAAVGNGFENVHAGKCRTVNMDALYNANVTDIFNRQYLSPRSPYTTLCVPTQGIGDWCSTKKTADINDEKFRSMIRDGKFYALDIPFRSVSEGTNIAYASLWDNYPDSICVPLSGKASHAYLLLAGSTNPMQYDIANGEVVVTYTDGTQDSLSLVPPLNWCPIEQDYLEDAVAFPMPQLRPYRVGLATGMVSRHLYGEQSHDGISRMQSTFSNNAVHTIPGGAAVMLDFPLQSSKRLRSLTLRVLSNEVVIGLMGVTLQK